MSVLSIIQEHCRLHALNVPSTVIGSTDVQVVQLFTVLKEVIEEIIAESSFQVTTIEATFVATAAEDQGALTTLAPSASSRMPELSTTASSGALSLASHSI